MKIHWQDLSDEIIERADFIEAVDPAARRALRIWSQDSFGYEASFRGARLGTLVVYMSTTEFGELKNRVRAVKGRLPAEVECLSL